MHVLLRVFYTSLLSRNGVAKQVAGPCYTVQSFSATFNIFDRGKLKTPRTQIVSKQNNKFAQKERGSKIARKVAGGLIHCAMALQVAVMRCGK